MPDAATPTPTPTSTPTSARARARAEITAEIIRVARDQLRDRGASELSLRAVARELGMVSSAVYRYFASRDELLTALIIDAYDSLGDAAERARDESARRRPRNQWVDVAMAVRRWALDHPHQYALVYGSPVPGFEAPPETSVSGTRVSLVLVGIVRRAAEDDDLRPRLTARPRAAVRADLDRLRGLIDLDVDDGVLMATLLAWTQLFGLLSFEIFGQTRGVFTAHEQVFAAAADEMAGGIGL